jgi:quercetin dioxygenase-like cupin family protein
MEPSSVRPVTDSPTSSDSARFRVLRSEETGAHGSVIEITAGATFPGPPLHVHDFDEAFYVLDGELTFQVRG